jgi:putative oxidoreductase
MNQNLVQPHSHSQSHDIGALGLRLSLGSILLAHGLMKLLVFGVAGTVGFFASLGLPAIVAQLTIFGEVAGGLAILLGVFTRLAAILSLPILLGAVWAHAGNGWVFSNAGGGWEFPVLLVVLAGLVATQGAGSYALERQAAFANLLPRALRA